MDKSQLVTIVVTAAITVICTVIFTSIFKSLTDSVALFAKKDATKSVAKKIFSFTNLFLAWFAYHAYDDWHWLILEYKQTTPITRNEIYGIVWKSMFASVQSLIVLFAVNWKVAGWYYARNHKTY